MATPGPSSASRATDDTARSASGARIDTDPRRHHPPPDVALAGRARAVGPGRDGTGTHVPARAARSPTASGRPHFVLRLTAPDGYTAARSYPVASAPDQSGEIELTVERLDGGEVSEFLHEVVVPGDELEVRGPIGGFFAWPGDTPALLVGGGSGVVPLMAMLRQARRDGNPGLIRLVVSARSPADLYYAAELPGPQTTIVHTREAAPGSVRPVGRLAPPDVAPLVRGGEDVFVCGSPAFCDAATTILVQVGVPVEKIRLERFGPSG